MISAAPLPVTVLDFQFKAHCRLKVFEKDPSQEFSSICNLIAVADRFGLIFVGGQTNDLQIIQVKHIENLYKAVSTYNRRVFKLPSNPIHLSINCDATYLAVIVEKDGCPFVIFYNTLSFLKQNVEVVQEIRLSATAGCKVIAIDWNPALPAMFTACKSDGSLGVYELKANAFEFHELPAAAGATCFCWSPKGKQIAIGGRDGKITQFKPDLKAVKAIDAPPGFKTIRTLCWLSSFQFMGIYTDASDQHSLICVDAPKAGAPAYTCYDDVCYSNGETRPVQFYLMYQQQWNVVMVASSNSTEVGVLGMSGNKWIPWNLDDDSRADLPLSAKNEETLPIGATLNLGVHKFQLSDDVKLVKEVPMLLVLSNDGVLCTFHVVNLSPNAGDVCYPLENVQDRSGDGLFTTGSASVAQKPKNVIAPIVSVPPPQLPEIMKPTAIASPKQQPLSFFGATSTLNNLPSLSSGAPSLGTTPSPLSSFASATVAQSQPQMFKPQAELPSMHVKPSQPSLPKQETPKTSETREPTDLAIPPTSGKLPINDETEAMIADLIREECYNLEAELNKVLQLGKVSQVTDVGSGADAVQIEQRVNVLETFYQDIKENTNTLDSEVYVLNQILMQTWVSFEEARTRFATSKDPLTKALLKSMPLDPASQSQLDEITRLNYYLESQLLQANQFIDERWGTFQDGLKIPNKMKLPTMESIYQTMIQHNKTVQKMKCTLNHISNRMKSSNRTNILFNMTGVEAADVDLQCKLAKMQLQSDNEFSQQYNKLIIRQSNMDKAKNKKLYDLVSKHETSRVCVSKPPLNNSTLQLSTLLAAPLSPIVVAKKGNVQPVKLDFGMSTPKPASQEIKVIKRPVQTFTPTTIATQTPFSTSSFGIKPFVSSTMPAPSLRLTAVPGTGSIGSNIASNAGSGNNFGSSASDTSLGGSQSSLQSFISSPKSQQNQYASVTSSASATNVTTAPSTQFGGYGSFLQAANSQPSIFDKVSPTVTAPTTKIFASEQTPRTTTSMFHTLASSVGAQAQISTATTAVSSAKAPAFGFAATSAPAASTTTSGFTSWAPLASSASPFASVPAVSSATTTTKPALLATPIITSTTTGLSQVPASSGNAFAFGTKLSSTGGIFAPTPTSSIFGGANTTSTSVTSSSTGNSLFATANQPKSSLFQGSMFGGKLPTTTTIATSDGQSANSNVFAVASAPSSNIFGASAATTTTTTKTPAPAPSTNVFGVKPTTTVAATPVSAPPASMFASVAPTTISEAAPRLFSAPATVSSSLFKPAAVVSPTPTTTPTSVFAPPATTTPFAAPAAFGSVAPTITTPTTTTAGATASVFGVSSTAPVTTTTSVFGAFAGTGTTTSPAGLFRTATTSTPSAFTASTTSSVFGATSPSPFSSAPVFGGSTFGSAPAATPTAGFAAATSPFGQATTTASSPFGQVTTTATSPFAQVTTTASSSPFGQVTTTASSSPFGQATTTATTSSTPFGGTNASGFSSSGSLFGQPAKFGTGSVFGGGTSTTSSFGPSPSIFGGSNTSNAPFGASTGGTFGTPTSPFGAPATTAQTSNTFGGSFSSSAFGTAQSPPAFGSPPASSTGTAFSSFGGLSVGGGSTTGNAFGSPAAANPFGRASGQPPTFGSTTTNLFATPTSTTSANVFGSPTPTTSASVFGNTSFGGGGSGGFGQQSTFGSTSFGGASPGGSFSSGAGSVQQSGFGGSPTFQKPGFGNAPVFGQATFGAGPTFGSGATFGGGASFGSPQKVFGAAETGSAFGGASPVAQSSTFGSIANQNTVGFGNLAQQATQQAQPLPFSGGSSFTNWRN